MVVGGLLMIVAVFLPFTGRLVVTLILGVTGVVVLIPVAYSYLLWRSELR